MKKKVLFGIVVVLAILTIWNIKLINYGVGQGIGQLNIVWNARPVSEYLEDPTVPDSIKQKLNFIKEVREYAVSELNLQDTENYTSMYDQKGQPILWVVTGCEPFNFEPKEWSFPVLGAVPYKGFFDKDKAQSEFDKVEEEGLDAGMRTVDGWSTLGWFTDPILSNMLERDWGDLANLIIHELVHSTIFVKDSIDFNENLASFIADKGAIMFLKDRFGDNSTELTLYMNKNHDQKLKIDHILRGADALQKLYDSFENESQSKKIEAKSDLIEEIMNSTDTLSVFDTTSVNYFKGKVPNNTYFMSYKRYESKQQDLSTMYEERFHENIKEFIDYLKQKHPFL